MGASGGSVEGKSERRGGGHCGPIKVQATRRRRWQEAPWRCRGPTSRRSSAADARSAASDASSALMRSSFSAAALAAASVAWSYYRAGGRRGVDQWNPRGDGSVLDSFGACPRPADACAAPAPSSPGAARSPAPPPGAPRAPPPAAAACLTRSRGDAGVESNGPIGFVSNIGRGHGARHSRPVRARAPGLWWGWGWGPQEGRTPTWLVRRSRSCSSRLYRASRLPRSCCIVLIVLSRSAICGMGADRQGAPCRLRTQG
jgi:hypothetical protein